MTQEQNPPVPKSIALNAPFLSTTCEPDFAVPTHKLPQVTPGRWIDHTSQEMVEVLMVDAVGVHYVALRAVDEEGKIFEHHGEIKTMNAAVFGLSHQPA